MFSVSLNKIYDIILNNNAWSSIFKVAFIKYTEKPPQ